MLEIHGLAGVQKIAVGTGDVQTVEVRDGRITVWLMLSTSTYPAALTPEEARYIAAQLVASADRVEASVGHGPADNA